MPLPSSQLGGRVRADADDDEIGVEFGAVAQHDLLDLVGSADLGDPDAAAHVDAFGAVQPRHQRADLLAEHRRERCRLRFHQDDIDAQPAQAGRHLAADEPGADDDRTAAPSPPRSRSARLSSKDRSTWMPGRSGNDGMRLGTRPVAMISSS